MNRQELIVIKTHATLPPMHHPNWINILAPAVLAVSLTQPSRATPTNEPIALNNLAAQYGFSPATQTKGQVHWKSKYSSVVFHTGSRRLLFNSRLFWLNGPITQKDAKWSISHTDADTVIKSLLQSRSVLKKQSYSLVVLDPGHGGKDPGAMGTHRSIEKRIVLDIAKRVKRKLLSSNVAVRMTREKDSTLTLPQRPRLATRWGGSVFVSIHANKASRKAAKGIETFVLPAAGFPSTTSTKPNTKHYSGNKHNAANTVLAGLIQQGLLAQTDTPDRGVKRARFSVLRDSTCPAALVEVGFLSNPHEGALLQTVKYRDKVAEGIARGILTYLVKAESSQAP